MRPVFRYSPAKSIILIFSCRHRLVDDVMQQLYRHFVSTSAIKRDLLSRSIQPYCDHVRHITRTGAICIITAGAHNHHGTTYSAPQFWLIYDREFFCSGLRGVANKKLFLYSVPVAGRFPIVVRRRRVLVYTA